MSIFAPFLLTCPCGETTRRELARTVSASRSPRYREEILSRTFQRFTCPACQRATVADGPFLYVDFETGEWFGCFPRTWESAWRDLEREPQATWQRAVVQHSPDWLREEADDYAIRCVFGLDALREKLLCADAEIDDVDLELVKLDLMRCGEPLSMHIASRPVLLAVGARQLSFAAGELRFAAPRARIDAIHAAEAWGPARAEITAGPYVDVGRLLIPGTAPSPLRARRTWRGGT